MGQKTEIAVFGGGCFWCTEAVFEMLKGVLSVTSGYAGGHMENPTYEQVSSGQTGHAEVAKIEFDPSQITYENLLTVFFATHDPTTLNRQGSDVGTQYRSIILYANDGQKRKAEDFITEIEKSTVKGNPVVTEVKPLGEFYEAEAHHKHYYQNNKDQPYCQLVISPKIEKVQMQFAALLESHKKYETR